MVAQEVRPLEIFEVIRDVPNLKLTIALNERLYKDQIYTIDIKFTGNITNNLVGFYRTSYTDLEGNVRWLATTQLASVYARTVFPCFDEPSFKAPFEISVARRTNMTALSNMPVRESEPM